MNNEFIIIAKEFLPLFIMGILLFVSIFVLASKRRNSNKVCLITGSFYIDCKHDNDGPDPCSQNIKKIDLVAISDLGNGFFVNK